GPREPGAKGTRTGRDRQSDRVRPCVPAPWWSRTAATASRRFSRVPAANPWSNRSDHGTATDGPARLRAGGPIPGQGREPTRPSCQPTAGVGHRDARVPRVGPRLGDGPARQRGASSPARGGGGGQTSYLEEGLGSPLGCDADPPVGTSFRLVPGSTLLLYTDGLVEKRGVSIQDGLERLETSSADCEQPIETFCERLLGSMVKGVIADDVALLAIRPVPLAGGPLLHVPAEPRMLAPLRHTLRRWLREIDAAPPVANDILVACGEVCANVIQHAYGAKEGLLEISLELSDGTAEVTVRDQGSWRPSSGIRGAMACR